MVRSRILKIIIYVVLACISSMHIAKMIFIGPSFNQITLVIFAFMIYAVYKENRTAYFYSFFTMAFIGIITSTNPAELNASVLLFIAIIYRSDFIHLMLSVSNILIGYILNAFVSKYDDFYNLPVTIIGNICVLVCLYFAVLKQPSDIDYLSKTTPLTPRQLIILKYLYHGVPRKEMPNKISQRELWKYDIDNFTFDIINAEIAKIKIALDLKTEFELGAWYESHVKNNRFISKS